MPQASAVPMHELRPAGRPPAPRQLPSLQPDIRLFGPVDQAMLSEFLRQQDQAPSDRPLVFELSTTGGNADIGRRIAQEIRLWRRGGQPLFFLGKSFVYSEGITVMAAFQREQRFLTADCELLIHERKLQHDLHLDGALRACATHVRNLLAQIESGQRLERAGFEELVDGSTLTCDALLERVFEKDWYLPAPEAQRLGLVAGLVG